ncbi:YdeI/OmpD-associated family protein [Modestobacter altitudinis]|uniref:YdeI/OmpD-associated family protein n=1 Tax=Modestobacter altitudinis TaxID=2213158 RepID=UPI00110CE9F2|nr:YdeI/OmpD-associated family protein [Modestobacter altitudinis]
MADDTTFETRAFPSAADFDAWLATEHDRAPGLFVKIAKKSAGIPSLTAAEAVEVALCHGWIDGRGNRVDDDWFTVRYTPRRPRSVWSQKNVETVARLIADGRMRPAGLAAVEAAQADGRWDRAYAGPATITVPDDLVAALAAEPAAESFFAGLDRTSRYAVLWRVHTAATPQTRANRIAACVQMLAEGRRFHG